MLTRSGWLVAVGAAATVVAGRMFAVAELFVVGLTGLALCLLAVVWVRRPAPPLHAERVIHPRRVHLGGPSRVELRITNRGRRRSPVLTLRDPVEGTVGARVAVGPLPPGVVHDAGYRLPTGRRGLLHIGPLRAELTDPFGLARRRFSVADAAVLTVLPAVEDLAAVPLGGGRDEPLAGQARRAVGVAAEDFSTLRPYLVGDDLRRIHWPSTARSGDLLVRQDDARWQGHVTVVLDQRTGQIDPGAFEAAVSAAASLVRSVARRGDRVRLVLTDGTDTGLVDARRGADVLLEHLALAQQHPDGALPAGIGANRHHGCLVIVTGWPHGADLARLVADAVPGTAIIVSVHPPGEPLHQGAEAGAPPGAMVVTTEAGRPFAPTWAAAFAHTRGHRR